MNKVVRTVLASGALVAAMCTGLAVTPAQAWYAYGGGGGVRVGVGVGGARVGVGYRGYYGYRGYGYRARYGYGVGVRPYGVRVGYPGVYARPLVYAPVVFVGPVPPAEPFDGHG